MTLPRAAALCAFALATHLGHAASLRLEASTTWAENISHSSAASDWRDAHRHEAQASLSLLKQWTAGLVSTSEVDAGTELVPRFARMNAFTAGIGTQLRQKFGFGALAPFVTVEGGLHHREARLAGDDGWTATAAVRVGKRLNESWRLGATGDWQQHDAASSIFDTRSHRVFGTITWDITPWLQLSHGNGRLWGDVTANASPAVWPRALSGALGSNISEYYNTVSWGTTDSFGPGWVTYRVTARASFWWLELAPAIGRNTSLPFRYESIFTVNKIGIKYRQDLWTVQWVTRF
jgi:hypothetical protein